MSRTTLAYLSLIVLVSLLGGACSNPLDEPAKDRTGNSAPTTSILASRAYTEGQEVRFSVSWTGRADDVSLAGFEVAVDEPLSWSFTPSSESTFVFVSGGNPEAGPGATDRLPDYHVLFIRAVDDMGAKDPTPEQIAISGDNILPVTVILRGPSHNGQSGTSVAFEWEGQDPDGFVVGYQYQLDDHPWVPVGADCTVVYFHNLTTARFYGDPSGLHQFKVVSVDDDGGVEQLIEAPRNYRRWESLQAISGSLRIDSNVMGTRFGLNNFEGAVFSGTRVAFHWSGDASIYGGVVSCYSYAYDLVGGFSECDLASTAYPPDAPYFIPPLGHHNLLVRALDDLGGTFDANFAFVVLPGPGSIPHSDRRILYVDDYDNGSGGGDPMFPDDPKEDAFWDSLLAGTNHSMFDANEHADVPPVGLLGTQSTIIWYVDDSFTQLELANEPGNFRNPLWAYLNAGGNVILCGQVTTDALTPDNHFDPIEVQNPGCPHEPQETYRGACGYCLDWFPAFCDTAPYHTVYDFLKLEQSFSDPSSRLARVRSVSPLVPDLALDLNKRGVGPGGKPLLIHGLEDCEQYLPRALGLSLAEDALVVPLWTYVSVDSTEARVCGLYVPKSNVDGRGNLLLLGFPPYFFHTLEMREVLRTFLMRFGETVAIHE